MLLRLARRADICRIPVRAHVIHHSIASAAAALGARGHELAEMSNHSDTNTVRRYVHGIGPDGALARVRVLLDAPAALDVLASLEGRVPCSQPIWTLAATGRLRTKRSRLIYLSGYTYAFTTEYIFGKV